MKESTLSSIIILFIYLFTQYPSIPGGDAGELLSEACHLGTPHPPGYPLFTLLSYLTIQLGAKFRILGLPCAKYSQVTTELFNSIGANAKKYSSFSPARSVNSLCNILGAGACYFISESVSLYLSSLSRTNSICSNDKKGSTMRSHDNNNTMNHSILSIAGAISGIAFGLSPLTWEYSIGTEVFALNNFLVSLIIYYTMRVSTSLHTSVLDEPIKNNGKTDTRCHSKKNQPLSNICMKGSFVCGLAMANQHTSLLFMLPLIPYVLWILYRNNVKAVSEPPSHPAPSTNPPYSSMQAKTFKTVALYDTTIIVFKLSLCFLAGSMPYTYLIYTAKHGPPKEGSWGDLTTIKGFVRHILRSEYGTLRLGAERQNDNMAGGSIARWMVYLANTTKQFTFVGIFLSLVGVVVILIEECCHQRAHIKVRATSKDKDERNAKKATRDDGSGTDDNVQERSKFAMGGVQLIVVYFFYLTIWNGIFSNLPLSDPMAYEVQSRFWMQPNIILSFLIGVGFWRITTTAIASPKTQIITARIILCLVLLSATARYYLSKDTEAMATQSGGWIMHDYGRSILDTLPTNSLLLSHSDLNWNTVRYFQTCEGKRRDDVTHLTIQLMPYPWFQRQINYGLYDGSHDGKVGGVVFPPILPDASTNRFDSGYEKLLFRFLKANVLDSKAFSGGVYIEMHAIPQTEIGDGGTYKDSFTLLPWGLLYRIMPKLKHPYKELPERWHPKSTLMIRKVREAMKEAHSETNVKEGSWEFAAMSVYWDMHYELGLHMLTLALDVAGDMKEDLGLVVLHSKCLRFAVKLLWQVDRAVKERRTISHPETDVIKNTALAHMRLYQVSKVTSKLKPHIPDLPDVTSDELKLMAVRVEESISNYLITFVVPDGKNEEGLKQEDKDYGVFNTFYHELMLDIQKEYGNLKDRNGREHTFPFSSFTGELKPVDVNHYEKVPRTNKSGTNQESPSPMKMGSI